MRIVDRRQPLHPKTNIVTIYEAGINVYWFIKFIVQLNNL